IFPSLVASLLTAADVQTATAKLSAAQIVDKNIAAQGGLQAWRGVQTMTWTGQMDAGAGDSIERSQRYMQRVTPGNGMQHGAVVVPDKTDKAEQVQLPFVMKMKRGRKSRVELQFAGKTAL